MACRFVCFLVVALWLSTRSDASLDALLPTLCQNPKFSLLLGSRCDPYISGQVDCVVTSWTAWKAIKAGGCQEVRTRTVTTFARNNGKSCPDLVDTRPCVVPTFPPGGSLKAFTTLKSALGGFGPYGAGNPAPPRYINILKNANFVDRNGTRLLKVSRLARSLESIPCPPDRDIVIVVDSSGSVGENKFKASLIDLGRIVPHLCGFQPGIITSCRSTRVAVVTYGREPRLVFDLNDSRIRHSYQSNVQNDIETMPQYLSSLSGATATGDALQFAASRVLQEQYGMRRHSKKTILLLTDGNSNHGSNPVTVASNLYSQYNEKLEIIALGIGNVNYNELRDITNHYNPFNPLVILMEDYRSFTKIVDDIIDMLQFGQDTCDVDKKRK